MNKKLDKNFIKQIIIIFFAIITTNYVVHFCSGYFSEESYKQYYNYDYILDKYSKYDLIASKSLFTNYEPHINTDNYPKTFPEYVKSNKNKNKSYSTLDSYTEIYSFKVSEETKSRRKLIKLLNNSKFQFKKGKIEPKLYPFENSRLFYNKYGNLIFIQNEKDSNTYYRYDIQGNLVEAEWYNGNEVSLIYSPDKLVKFIVYRSYSMELEPNRISYKQYCYIIHIKIILLSIKIFAFLTIFLYLKRKNFFRKVDKNYIQEFIKNNPNIKKYKTSIWSHLLAIIGLLYIHQYIRLCIEFYGYIHIWILYFLTLLGIIILIPIGYIIELFFIKNYQLKWQFIYENKIYNYLWIIGIIVAIFTIITTIITTILMFINPSIF